MLDAIPGLVPIYFSTNISINTEEISGLIITGQSESNFYLDTRPVSEMDTSPSLSDLAVIFEIYSNSEISDEDAELMTSSINDNKNLLTFWTNFDVLIDFLVFLIHLISVGLIISGIGVKQYHQEEEVDLTKPTGLLELANRIK